MLEKINSFHKFLQDCQTGWIFHDVSPYGEMMDCFAK